jgi:uncharacterized damage-inducible protein DinB
MLDYDQEMMLTRRLLERVPLDDAHRAYRPHPKSPRLDGLASHVAELPAWFRRAIEKDGFLLTPETMHQVVSSTAELLEEFDRGVVEGREWIQKAKDEEMFKDWTFRFGDIVSETGPRAHVVRSFLNHLVHHRAQLGVYLRLNDIPIPGMYGPSADEAWSAPS